MSRPRIRTIKPEMWADEKIGALTHGARLLFVGLITMADDEGRLRAMPALILGHVFPYDEAASRQLPKWVGELTGAGLIVSYEAGGLPYMALPGWAEHQKINRPTPSELPPPSSLNDHGALTERSVNDHGTISERSENGTASQPVEPSRLDEARTVRDLFEYWTTACNHPQAKPTRDRLAKITARLREGYTPQQIRTAIDGAARDAFVDDKGKRFDDLELICRNGTKLESFIQRATPTNGAPPRASIADRLGAA